MASSSIQPGATTSKSILTPVMTLDGHKPWTFTSLDGTHEESKGVSCISYFPDGKQMISGSFDETIRQWDLREGKEIEEAREVCENLIRAVGVSRDGRWVVTASGRKLKVSDVETGTVRTFHEGQVGCIDISSDSTLLAGGSYDSTVRIWRLDTDELVAGPFKLHSDGYAASLSLRFSGDSRKLAVFSHRRQLQGLQVWDVQAQKLDIQKKFTHINGVPASPVFWTTKNKSIVTAFNFYHDLTSTRIQFDASTIIEFDASTLKTVGAPFKGHACGPIEGLALSSDCALLVCFSYHDTIELWAFESRQLLASFNVNTNILSIVLSPDSRQLAYTSRDDAKIYICDIPANILASIGLAEELQPGKRLRSAGLLDSDATRPVRRKPVIIPVMSPISHPPRPLPTSDPHTFLRFVRKLLSSSPRTDAVYADESRNPLDFPATSPLPRPPIKPDENSRSTPAPPTTQSPAINTSPTFKSSLHRLSPWWPFQTDHALPAINAVDVPLAPAKLRYATAGAPGPDDDLIRDEDYVSPPSPIPGSRRGIVNAGQHGSSRFCFCF